MSIYRRSLKWQARYSGSLFPLYYDLFRTVYLSNAIGSVVSILVGSGQAVRFFRGVYDAFRYLAVVIKGSGVRYLSTSSSLYRDLRNLLGEDLQVRAIVVRSVCVVRPGTFRTLIGANSRVLATSPISVESQPRVVTYLYTSSRLVSMYEGFLSRSFSGVFLHASKL